MMSINQEVDILLHYQRKYGRRGTESWNDWVLKKRAIATAVRIISSVEGLEFSEYEQYLYFRCDDPRFKKFIRAYESQMEEAILYPDDFVKNLDVFYRKTCYSIEKGHMFRDYFDFCDLVSSQRRQEMCRRKERVLEAYISLLMQQTMYFSRHQLEHSVVGMEENGELIFRKNPHPFIDAGAYQLEAEILDFIKGKQVLSSKKIYEAYKTYGYEVHSLDEIEVLEHISRLFDNNQHEMIPYISDRTEHIVLQTPYQHNKPEFPRQWRNTEWYLNNLQFRNYLLPTSGIHARYVNAGDIAEIFFQEVMKNEEIVLLYRVVTKDNGEYSGYYRTASHTFYSPFLHSNCEEWHRNIENFILENYMMLTCDYLVDKKKNYAMRQVDSFEKEFYFPYQPLVTYSYKASRGRKAKDGQERHRRFVKEEYRLEIMMRSGHLRRLPERQQASEKAVQNAINFGISLPPGMTFVNSHEFRVFRKVD